MSVFRFIFAEPEFVDRFCPGCKLRGSQIGCACPREPARRYNEFFKKTRMARVPPNFLCLPGLRWKIDRQAALVDHAVFKRPNMDPLGTLFGGRVRQELVRLSARDFGESLKASFDEKEILRDWFVFTYGYHVRTGNPYWGLYRPGYGTLWFDFNPNFTLAAYYFAQNEAQSFGALEERRGRYV